MKSPCPSPPTTSTCWRERRSEEWRRVHSWSVQGVWRMLRREAIARNAQNVGGLGCCAGRRSSLRSLPMLTLTLMPMGCASSLPVFCGLATAVAIDGPPTSQKVPEPASKHRGYTESASARYAQATGAIRTIMRSVGRSGCQAIVLEAVANGAWGRPACHTYTSKYDTQQENQRCQRRTVPGCSLTGWPHPCKGQSVQIFRSFIRATAVTRQLQS